MEKTRIELYKQREFGEVFNAAFAFIKQEIKPLGRAILVFILPIVLLQGIITSILMSSMMDAVKNIGMMADGPAGVFTFFRIYALIMLAVLITQSMVLATIISYLKLYNSNNGEITIADLGNEIKSNFLSVLGAIFIAGLLMIVGFVFCILPGIYVGVSLSVIAMAVIFEKQGIGNAFSRSFTLVHTQWWWTFLLLFVTVILMYVIIMVFQIPAYIFGFATMFHSFQQASDPTEAFGTFYIIYSSITTAIQQIIFIIPILLVAFQYFNLVEKKEKTSLSQKLNILGDNA
jgi:hypothetical protein